MKTIKEAILEKSFQSEGKTKLSCFSAFEIAADLNVRPSEIGDLCREENIRICKCQLNCF